MKGAVRTSKARGFPRGSPAFSELLTQYCVRYKAVLTTCPRIQATGITSISHLSHGDLGFPYFLVHSSRSDIIKIKTRVIVSKSISFLTSSSWYSFRVEAMVSFHRRTEPPHSWELVPGGCAEAPRGRPPSLSITYPFHSFCPPGAACIFCAPGSGAVVRGWGLSGACYCKSGVDAPRYILRSERVDLTSLAGMVSLCSCW